MIEGSQIDERLDRRARRPFCLSRAVELTGCEAEATADRKHTSGVRINRYEGAGDLGDLAQGVKAGRLAASGRIAFRAANRKDA